MQPGTALRCDGVDSEYPDKPDLSVTFVAFPYFDIGSGGPPSAQMDDSIHSPRGLFQSAYPQEATHDRDADQMFQRLKNTKSGDYLCIPQVWALLIRSRLVVTCGPSSLTEMLDGITEIITEESLLASGPSIVHVTDFFGRVNYLPLENCKTYLALCLSIEKECLEDGEDNVEGYTIHAGDPEAVLQPSQWPGILQGEKSAFVLVRLSRNTPLKTLEGRDSHGLTTPKAPALIEYADLSSDDGLPDPDNMALTLRYNGY